MMFAMAIVHLLGLGL